MRVALLSVAALIAACKENAEEAAPAPPLLPPSPRPPPSLAPAAVDGGPPINEPPLTSRRALEIRAAFFDQLNESAKRAPGHCRDFRRDLEKLEPDAMRILFLRSKIMDDALLAQDTAMVMEMMKQLLIASRACGLESVESMVHTVGDIPTWDEMLANKPAPK